MEALKRKPFQGLLNIIRFNWHFYAIAFGALIALAVLNQFLPYRIQTAFVLALILACASVTLSLVVSFYVYDCSSLYTLTWLDKLEIGRHKLLVNINAGFDETSALIKQKYPDSDLVVFDFYDPQKHTEVSIKRARKAYPAFGGTQTIATTSVPLNANSVDCIFLLLSAHEVRNPQERIDFFKELRRVLNRSGKIVVVEHLRDINNFIAYTIGFFHFYSAASWKHTFNSAGLTLVSEFKITPFISAFVLEKNGTTT